MIYKKRKKESTIYKIFTFIFNSIKNDFRTKAVFFIIGFILWFTINLDKETEINIDIPIKINNLQPGKVLLNKIPKFANIRLRAKGNVLMLSNLDENLYFNIDASGVTDSLTVRLNSDIIVNSTSNEIKDIFIYFPTEINLILDDYIEKKVPVHLNAKYSVAPGYIKTGEFNSFPDSIYLSGPASKAGKIKSIESVHDKGIELQNDYSKEIPLVLIDSSTINYSHKNVKVLQKIVRKGIADFLTPVQLVNKPKNMNILIDPIAITILVEGPVNELQEISTEDFKVTADARKIDNLKNIIPIKIESTVKLPWEAKEKEIKAMQY